MLRHWAIGTGRRCGPDHRTPSAKLVKNLTVRGKMIRPYTPDRSMKFSQCDAPPARPAFTFL